LTRFLFSVRHAAHGARRVHRRLAFVAALVVALSHATTSTAQDVEPQAGPEIATLNLDGAPFNDRLAFSRIGTLDSPPPNGVHDESTIRVRNDGTATLTISALNVVGPWTLLNAPSLPRGIAPGGQLDLTLRFIASGGDVHIGSMFITSNDADESRYEVELGGFWQSVPEGGQEPSLAEMMRVFGYTTTIVYAGERLSNRGLVQPVGNEVVAAYWQRASTSSPVTVRQLASYRTQFQSSTVFWFNRGSNATTALASTDSDDAQTVLPRRNGSSSPLVASFTPGTTFGFKVDDEWSDPAKNDQDVDRANGCPGPCGHHVRFWQAYDGNGKLIPNRYLVAMDYAGINYDYNDNVYVISNITPVSPRSISRVHIPVIRR
jgi:hypothetical protein